MGSEKHKHAEKTALGKVLSVIYFLAVLYCFFFCIELMGASFKLFGKETAEGLFAVTNNPIVGLVVGILATSIMQSSSSTTSIVVGLVAAGTLQVEQAVPMIMGANIGTTITNTIVSLGHVQRKKEFERAFSGAVVHDFFNLLSVALFLPLEIIFHPIQRTAQFVSSLTVGIGGAEFKSPLKAVVKPAVEAAKHLGELVISNPRILAVVLLVLALALLLFSLSRMVKIMRGAMAEKLEILVDKYLFTGPVRGFAIGIGITALVQSSSVSTSMVVPLLGAGIVRLEMVFPYMMGANIGTTVTAFLAALVTGDSAAVTVAFCHFFFNVFGIMVFFPAKKVPIGLARWMGRITAERRWIPVVYIGVAFFIIPAILVIIFRQMGGAP